MAKRKLKNLIVLSLISVFLFFGLSIIQAGEIPQIPEDIKKMVAEKDWVELYCYEAKSRGGEAIAKVEALAELLLPLLDQVEEFGVKVIVPDYAGIIKDLESKLEAICQQSTVEAAQVKVQEFISTAEGLRGTLGKNLRSQIEPPLRAKGEEIKNRLKKELKAEAEAEGGEVETGLRAQAQAEANQRKEEIRQRLQKQIEEQLKAEFEARKIPEGDNSALLEELKRKGPEIGNKLGTQEGERARVEIQAKYEKLAGQERERLRKKYEKKADEIGGEEKRKLEGIRDGFLDFEEKLNSSSQAKMARWLIFKNKAVQKKKDILIATMGVQIDKGKELIMAHKSEFDEARAAGKDIFSAEELVAQLEADKQALIAKLASGELNEFDIRQAGEDIKNKWNKIRFDMEKIQANASQEIYKIMSQRLAEKGFTRERIANLEPENHAFIVLKEFLNYNENSDIDSLLKYKEKLITTLAEYRTSIK